MTLRLVGAGILLAGLGCRPSAQLLPAIDGASTDLAGDSASSDATTTADVPGADTPSPDSPPVIDVAPLDVVAVDAPLPMDTPVPIDAPTPVDLAPPFDVPAPTDVPAASDTPPPGDAGTCPAGMRLIPGREFTMGGEDLASHYPSIAYVRNHRVRVSAFCMDEADVSVDAYGRCPVATCTAPGTAMYCNWGVAGRESHPVNCVDWAQASAHCQWRGATLPTEAQWEYAARYPDGRRYPWGDAPPSTQQCWTAGGTTGMSTCATGSFPAGNSALGLSDLGGNVYQWAADWYGPYPSDTGFVPVDPTGASTGTTRAVRGGPWYGSSVAYYSRAASRDGLAPTFRGNGVGFRCARGPL